VLQARQEGKERGTKVRHSGKDGVFVMGEATIKDSSIAANGRAGVGTWKVDDGAKAIVTIWGNEECSGNITLGDYAEYTAMTGGTFLGLPAHLIVDVI